MYKVFGIFRKKKEAANAFKDLLDNGYELSDLSLIYDNKKSTVENKESAEYIRHKLSKAGISGDIADIYDKEIEKGGIFLSAPAYDEHELGFVTVVLDDNNAIQIRVAGDWNLKRFMMRR